MINSIRKFIFVLTIWAFFFYGLMILKLDGHLAILGQYLGITSTTTNRYFPRDVLIDKRSGLDDESLHSDIESRIPSLPITYWSKTKNNDNKKSANCAIYPPIFDLEFNNIYWQTARTSNGTFQLFGAYYDIRNSSPIGPAVRILGMIDRIQPSVETYCQFWFDDQKEPIIVKTIEHSLIWYREWGNDKHGILQPYLIACQIPEAYHGIVPATVSIVENECDTATNNLRVIYNPAPDQKKKGFAVCVKGLDFLYDDMSVRMIEWIEMIKILGADKIFFYQLHIHPNISKILKHYEQEGLVQVTPLTLTGNRPNAPGLQHLYLYNRVDNARQSETIPYNDCLYKNMYMYDFIALLDIDEVILPKNDMTWAELMQRVLPKSRQAMNGTYPSYNVRNVYFLDENHALYEDIPSYLLMLQHVNRALNYSERGVNVKCFHNTEKVLSLHNHYPKECLEGYCPSYDIDTEDAQMHHYCALSKKCEEFRETSIKDTTIWKYKDELMRRSVSTLDQLGFYQSPKETNELRWDLLKWADYEHILSHLSGLWQNIVLTIFGKKV